MWEAIEGTPHCSSEEVSSGNMETKGLAAGLNSSLDFSLETHTCPQLPQFRGAPGQGRPLNSPRTAVALYSGIDPQCPVQPETRHSLEAGARHRVTGSQAHTLGVMGLEDSGCLFTLQSHSEAIKTMYTD